MTRIIRHESMLTGFQENDKVLGTTSGKTSFFRGFVLCIARMVMLTACPGTETSPRPGITCLKIMGAAVPGT